MQIETLCEFENHEKVIRVYEPSVGLSGFIAVHKRRGENPCLGATRLWKYKSEKDAINDALRLSRLMTRKSALAGLPYGGAKAVLIQNPKMEENRKKAFALYARIIENLNGLFVTGSDVGVFSEDVQNMRNNSQYIIGAGVPAGYYTALGVLEGIKAVLDELYGSTSLVGRSFAIQGLGKTGFALFELLAKDAGKIVVVDIDKEVIEKAKKIRPDIKVVQPSKIHTHKVDVFCPCALSHSINEKTISELRCKAVVGSANNQLLNQKMGELLHKKGVLYAPDYIVNSGGLISVVDQFENRTISPELIEKKIKNIRGTLKNILSEAIRNDETPCLVAERLAQKVINGGEEQVIKYKKAKEISYEKDWWKDSGGFFGELYAEADNSYEGFLRRPEDMNSRVEKEVKGVIRLCNLKEGDSVMDCPCGYGRHSLGLWQKKLNVHGVDVNTEHLNLAKKQAERMGADDCLFTQKDMRKLSFNEEFNAVINMFYSFGFFDEEKDDLLAVQNFCKSLKPGGKFLMHTFITVPKIYTGDYKKYDIRTLSSGNQLELFRDYDPETKRENGEWYIVYKDGTKKMLAPYSMRIYSNTEFDILCRKAGFKKVDFYGDWDGTPYRDSSELLIAVATK